MEGQLRQEGDRIDVEDALAVQDAPEDEQSAVSPAPGASEKPARRQLTIEYIDDRQKRHISFSKRKAGIMKKAYELSTLTGTQVLLVVVSETGLVYTYTTCVACRPFSDAHRPVLAPLVTTKDGKDLMLQCLAAPNPTPEQIAEMDARADHGEPIASPYMPDIGVDDYAQAPGSRQVKRRKTVENMRSPGGSRSPLPSMPQLAHDVDAALETARTHPSIRNIIDAYASRTPGHLPLSIEVIRHYLQELDHTNSVLINAGAETFEMVFERIAQAGALDEAVRGELINFVAFLWSNAFISPQLQHALSRIAHGGMAPTLPLQTYQIQQQQRLAAIGAALTHYASYVVLTYRGGVLGTDILEGMLLVQSVHETFIIVEDPAAVGSVAPPAPPANTAEDTMLPLKLRIPPDAGQYIRPGDRLTLHIARLAHPAHHWAPTAFVSAHGPARGPNAISSEDHALRATSAFQRERLDRATKENDEQEYHIALEAYKRADRGERLAGLGELDPDGYSPSSPPQYTTHAAQYDPAIAQPRSMPDEDSLGQHLAPYQPHPVQSDQVEMTW